MEVEFKRQLAESDLAALRDFHRSVDDVTVEQVPAWNDVMRTSGTWFIARRNGAIVCSALVTEKRLRPTKTAVIQFGPVFRDPEDLVEAIGLLRDGYRRRGFLHLAIQLGFASGPLADYVEATLYRSVAFRQYFDRANWSSVRVDLSADPDRLAQRYSKGHRSAVRKAQRLGLTVQKVTAVGQVAALAEVYTRMRAVRGLFSPAVEQLALLERIFHFISVEGAGHMLVVTDPAGATLGGLVILRQGRTMRYYLGAADPLRRDVPVLHLAIHEAACIAREEGCAWLDLWGYNFFATPGDQYHNVNIFKKGFGGEYVFYPKVMHIPLRRGAIPLYRLLTALKMAAPAIRARWRARRLVATQAAPAGAAE